MDDINYLTTQLHAGNKAEKGKKEKLWHTDTDGLYWCGSWYHRTPEQLLKECKSTIKDLLKLHPELINKL